MKVKYIHSALSVLIYYKMLKTMLVRWLSEAPMIKNSLSKGRKYCLKFIINYLAAGATAKFPNINPESLGSLSLFLFPIENFTNSPRRHC